MKVSASKTKQILYLSKYKPKQILRRRIMSKNSNTLAELEDNGDFVFLLVWTTLFVLSIPAASIMSSLFLVENMGMKYEDISFWVNIIPIVTTMILEFIVLFTCRNYWNNEVLADIIPLAFNLSFNLGVAICAMISHPL